MRRPEHGVAGADASDHGRHEELRASVQLCLHQRLCRDLRHVVCDPLTTDPRRPRPVDQRLPDTRQDVSHVARQLLALFFPVQLPRDEIRLFSEETLCRNEVSFVKGRPHLGEAFLHSRNLNLPEQFLEPFTVRSDERLHDLRVRRQKCDGQGQHTSDPCFCVGNGGPCRRLAAARFSLRGGKEAATSRLRQVQARRPHRRLGERLYVGLPDVRLHVLRGELLPTPPVPVPPKTRRDAVADAVEDRVRGVDRLARRTNELQLALGGDQRAAPRYVFQGPLIEGDVDHPRLRVRSQHGLPTARGGAFIFCGRARESRVVVEDQVEVVRCLRHLRHRDLALLRREQVTLDALPLFRRCLAARDALQRGALLTDGLCDGFGRFVRLEVVERVNVRVDQWVEAGQVHVATVSGDAIAVSRQENTDRQRERATSRRMPPFAVRLAGDQRRLRLRLRLRLRFGADFMGRFAMRAACFAE